MTFDRRRFIATTAGALLVAGTARRASGAERPAGNGAPSALPPMATTTFYRLGTQTLDAFLRSVRAALPEGAQSANSRLGPPYGLLAYCGATIWQDRYSLGIAGGHGDSYDDGHYAQDLATGRWEMLLPPSTVAGARAKPDAYGEWIGGRPASQHSYQHLVTVDDAIVQGYGYAIGAGAGTSQQAHRWTAAGGWQRYGNGGTLRTVPHVVHYDAGRDRLVRFALEAGRSVDTIAAHDPEATWATVSMPWWPGIGIYASVGYHPELDCFVLVDPPGNPGQAWVLAAGSLPSGWQRVTVEGGIPGTAANCGLEYVPPRRALAAAHEGEPDALYLLAPTGGAFDGWRWTRESLLGPAARGQRDPALVPARWDVNPGVPIAPFGRVRWSSRLNALVMVKSALEPTEVVVLGAVR